MRPIFEDGQHEYDYEMTTDEKGVVVHSLYYSKAEVWTNPGKHLISLVDTGNEFKIKADGFSRKVMEYDEAIWMAILMKIIFRDRDLQIADSLERI